MQKLRQGPFKHVESELYHYHETLREIQTIREEILHAAKPQDENIGGGKSNVPGNPTQSIAIALATNRKMDNLERVVQVIQFVYTGLPDEKKRLVELKYWQRPQTLTWDGIALRLNVSRRTALNWREEIVFAVAHLMGW